MNGEKRLDFGNNSILKVESVGFVDGLNVGVRKRRFVRILV